MSAIPTEVPQVLHILNGDSVLPTIRASGLDGEFAVWGDVLWEGPLLPAASPDEQRRARARYFADPGEDPAPLLAMVEAWDRALEGAGRHDEVVLWLEHDLHDQFQLIHHLDFFSRRPHPRLSLICISEFPGVVPFHGLGQLNSAQLATLLPTRHPVTAPELELGRRAWEALVAPSPLGLERLASGDTLALPYLASAIRRFLEEYPEVGTGLSRTERVALTALDREAMTLIDLFRAVQRQEQSPFMGDSTFWRIVRGLGRGAAPLLSITPASASGAELPGDTVALTQAGREVLAGRRDRIALLGIDRWLGGVHLEGRSVPWRWDPQLARLRPDGG